MDKAPSTEAIKLFLQRDRMALDERSWTGTDQFGGKNSENLAIILRSGGNELEPARRDLLQKILAAIKLNIEHVHLIDLDKHTSIRLADLRGKSFEHLIFFGILPAEIGLNVLISTYQSAHWQGLHLLFAHSLADLERSLEYKKALWATLKSSFL